MDKKTIVIGASPNPERYAYKAVQLLQEHGHTVIALGKTEGAIGELSIDISRPSVRADTISLYINPQHQTDWYSYILSVQPSRLIFNPGTENPELVALANAHGIDCIEACTLVMLNTGQY